MRVAAANPAARPAPPAPRNRGERLASDVKDIPRLSRRERSDELRRAEERLLEQERSLTGDPKVRDAAVQYEYTIGPDGSRYITGARVTYREADPNRTPEEQEAPTRSSSVRSDLKAPQAREDPRIEAAVAELQKIDREVRAHEAAHMAAGGAYAGSASFSYVQGPDGKLYAVGGEVSISAPSGRTAEEAIRIMEQVRAAALAPAAPSGQDFRVAAAASAALARARQELPLEKRQKTPSEGIERPRAGETALSGRSPERGDERRQRGGLSWGDPDDCFSFIASIADRDRLFAAYSSPWAMGRRGPERSTGIRLGSGLVA